ncbi:hypothetical protein ACRAWD_06960 [Caulobacter segnis]
MNAINTGSYNFVDPSKEHRRRASGHRAGRRDELALVDDVVGRRDHPQAVDPAGW